MIVKMTKEHVPEVAEIEKLCFSDPWSEHALSESIACDYAHFSVYLENGKVIGYMGFYALFDEGSVTNVATHPDYRGRGVGTALMQHTIELCRKRSVESITLEVRESNITAQRLYEKCGFERVGVRKNFYSLPRENALIMQWKQ